MRMWGKLLALATLGLAGCVATAPVDSEKTTVLQDQYLRDSIRFYSSLADVQQALFANQRLCGSEFEWALDPYQIHYATVVYKATPGADFKDSLVFDLTAYNSGFIVAKVYSYFALSSPESTRALSVLQDPKVCLNQSSPSSEN